jgi:hypothetical protein
MESLINDTLSVLNSRIENITNILSTKEFGSADYIKWFDLRASLYGQVRECESLRK